MLQKIIFITLLFIAPSICYADTPWGVNLHLRERVPEAEWDETLAAASQARVEWAREQFNWDVIESTDGDYDFSQYDKIISKYQAEGINVLGLITYSSSWASANPGASDYYYYPPDEEAWQDYVYQIAWEYKDSIDYWEIWNEPNHDGFWKGTDEEYAILLRQASIKIKEANPEAKIVLGGLSGTDTEFLENIYQNSDQSYFDIIAIHPYRVKDGNFNYSPEYTTDGLNTLLVDLRNLDRFLRTVSDQDKPVWLTEIGWTTYSEGVARRTQANMLLRSFLQALIIPQVEKVFWYSFKDDSSADYLESNFGLMTDELTEKKSSRAYEFLAEHLRGDLKYKQTLTTSGATALDYFDQLGDWHFQGAEKTDGQLAISQGQLKIHYQFKKKNANCYLPTANKIKLPAQTRALIFDAKGDNKNNDFKFRITDASGETFQYEVGKLAKKWQTYQIPLKNYASYWNGDANGQLDEPLYFESFILDDNPDGNQTAGDIYLDNLTATKDGHTYLYKYRKNGEKYYVVWNTTGTKNIRAKLGQAKKIKIFALGKSTIKTSADKYFNLKASYTPKIIKVLK